MYHFTSFCKDPLGSARSELEEIVYHDQAQPNLESTLARVCGHHDIFESDWWNWALFLELLSVASLVTISTIPSHEQRLIGIQQNVTQGFLPHQISLYAWLSHLQFFLPWWFDTLPRISSDSTDHWTHHGVTGVPHLCVTAIKVNENIPESPLRMIIFYWMMLGILKYIFFFVRMFFKGEDKLLDLLLHFDK